MYQTLWLIIALLIISFKFQFYIVTFAIVHNSFASSDVWDKVQTLTQRQGQPPWLFDAQGFGSRCSLKMFLSDFPCMPWVAALF